MFIQRRTIRAAATLNATEVWTGPAIRCFMAHQINLWIKATNANAPVAFAWEVSDDGVVWQAGAPPVQTQLQGDTIAAQSLNNAGNRKAILTGFFSGGCVSGMPWRFARPLITGHATLSITGLEVIAAVAYLIRPTITDNDNALLG